MVVPFHIGGIDLFVMWSLSYLCDCVFHIDVIDSFSEVMTGLPVWLCLFILMS